MRATATGPLRLESCVWRYRGRLQVSACATLRYRLAPGQVVATLEQAQPRRASHRAGLPLEPYLARAEVLFVGADRGGASRERHVRFSVHGPSCAVDRVIRVGGGAARGRGPAALGPIPWPARPGWREEAFRTEPGGAIALDDDFSWDALQSAPPEQQCAGLTGEEWILLDGLHPEVELIHARLPGWAPRMTAAVGPRRGPLDVRADRLLVWGDESAAELTWRAIFEVPPGVSLDDVAIDAFVERAGAMGIAPQSDRTVHLGGPIEAASPRTVALVAGDLIAAASPEDEGTLVLLDEEDGEDGSGVDGWLEEATASASLAASTQRTDAARSQAERTLAEPPRRAPEHAIAANAPEQTMDVAAAGWFWPFEQEGSRSESPLPPAEIPGAPWSSPRSARAAPSFAETAMTLVLGAAVGDVPRAGEAPANGAPAVERIGSERRKPLVVLADTGWSHAIVRDRLRPPRDSITLVVKASFALAPDGELTRVERPEVPQGERFDERSRVTPAAPYELSPLKLEADVLLTGHAYPPRGRATASEVVLRFGHRHARIERRFAIVGPRTFRTVAGVVTGVSEPEPFERVPLIYENAFGGPALEANPAGVGHPSARRDGDWRLPSIEDPRAPLGSPADRPRPACPAPRPRAFRIDRPRAGAFGAPWLGADWPFRDAGFDPYDWQAAPVEQRLPELAGDEPFELVGVHPERRAIAGRLPGVVPAVFTAAKGELAPFAMRLDTVLFDADAMRVDLVWRGVAEVADFDRPDFDAFVIVEAGEAALERARSRIGPPAEKPGVEAEEVRQDRPGVDLRGRDLRGSDHRGRTLKRAALQGAVLSGACFAEVDFTGADLSAATLEGTDLRGADLTGAKLDGALLDEALLEGATLDRASLVGASLRRCRAERASFAGADLTAASLDGADLRAAQLPRAVLERATFSNARLESAVLIGCCGRDVGFLEAGLSGACGDEASLPGACFDGAALAESTWSRANLDGASARRADLRQAVLTDASCRAASFAGADLAEALLDAADCAGASFAGANLRGASLEKAILVAADLRGACCYRVGLWRARLDGADLDGAFTAGSRVEGP